MPQKKYRTVTIIFYTDVSLELHHETHSFVENKNGRIIIPQPYKEGKSIIAVCDGEIQILNKVGDRILLIEDIK